MQLNNTFLKIVLRY